MTRRWVFLLMAAFFPGSAWAQAAGQISGTVTASGAGAPLAGATVTVVGTDRSATTGANGRYTLANVAPGTYQLSASLAGYAARAVGNVTVRPGQTTAANFQLQSQTVQLEGVTVAVGYGTQRKEDVTGSVVSVKAEDIRQIPTPNAVDAIKGRVPGVDVVASGNRPGQGVSVRVRGARSMKAGNEPLYVVDGIPLAGGIQDFNPGDIQSIDVLKDASATAIYGSRGANGVVLITTRKGQGGETRIAYDTYYGVQNIHRKIDVMDGPAFAEYKREAFRAVGKYKCPGTTACPEGDRDLFTTAELAGLANGTSTDWQDLILRTGQQQNHQVGITGGNASTRFSVSANYFDQVGVTRGMDYVRRSGAFSVDHTAGRLKVGVSSNVSNGVINEGRGNGLWGEALQDNPLGSPYNADGTLNPLPVPDGQRWNPLLDVANHFQEESRTRVFASIYADLELAEGVNFRSNFGPDMTFRRNGDFRGAMTQVRRGGSPDAQLFRDQTFAYTLSNFLTVDREVGEDHRVNATLLYEIQEQRQDSLRGIVSELPYEHQRWYN
ncbi:MAG: SusC/RagA family TonB-linked outer membrane protein, partial [Gemmatimonadota bacterium]|nr:SusC/RagA family TonB-linked outer membrane protein [Gemmatimonadota bacterium]